MEINALEILKESGALLEGHFLLSSGKHSNKYCQCAKLMQYPEKAEKVISLVANQVQDLGIDVIVGPAMGGIRASYELGRQLGIRTIFTERVNNIMVLKRGFEVYEGEKILIMEDVVTTAKSSMETAQTLENFGAKVIGIGCIVNREESNINIPIFSSIKLKFESYEPAQCPLCEKGIGVVKPGSRKFN